MKAAIVYTTKHGTTQKVVQEMKALRPDLDIDLINLKDDRNPDLDNYSAIIVGTPVYRGMPPREIEHFCIDYIRQLQTKKLGLFLCGMMPAGEERHREMEIAYAYPLVSHASAFSFFEGTFTYDTLGWLERFMAKRFAGVTQSMGKVNKRELCGFMNRMFPA